MMVKTHVDKFCLVSGPQVVEDRGLVEISEIGHVLTFLKLGRVHLADREISVQFSDLSSRKYLLDLFSLEHFLIMTDGHLDFSTVLSLQQALHEPSISVRNPVGLLGIVGLGHVLPLHLEGEEEVGGGVRVLAIRGPFLLVSRHAGGELSLPLSGAELQ